MDQTTSSNSSSSSSSKQSQSKPQPPHGSSDLHSLPIPLLPGLINLGNTCYMNSVLQEDKSISQLVVSQSLISVIRALSQPSQQSIRPIELLQQVAFRNPDYLSDQQQDAHEFFHVLLSLVRNEEDLLVSENCPNGSQPSQLEQGSLVHQINSHDRSSISYSPPVSSIPLSASDEPLTGSESSHSSIHSLLLPASSSVSSSSSYVYSPLNSQVLKQTHAQDESHQNLRATPLLDSIFSGSLTQYTVCENLHVSKVTEPFLDLSLATKSGSGHSGKRSKISKTVINRLKGSNLPLPSLKQEVNKSQVLECGPLSDDQTTINSRARRSSFTQYGDSEVSLLPDRSPRQPRRLSIDSCEKFNVCAPRPTFWANNFLSSAGTTTSSPSNQKTSDQESVSPSMKIIRFVKRPSKKKTTEPRSAISPTFANLKDEAHKEYVRKILLGPSSKPTSSPNPLRALKFSQSTPANQSSSPIPHTNQSWLSSRSNVETDLHDLLRRFASVEVLEGENSFACQQCWKEDAKAREDAARLSPTAPLAQPSSSATILPDPPSDPSFQYPFRDNILFTRAPIPKSSDCNDGLLRCREEVNDIPTIRIVARSRTSSLSENSLRIDGQAIKLLSGSPQQHRLRSLSPDKKRLGFVAEDAFFIDSSAEQSFSADSSFGISSLSSSGSLSIISSSERRTVEEEEIDSDMTEKTRCTQSSAADRLPNGSNHSYNSDQVSNWVLPYQIGNRIRALRLLSNTPSTSNLTKQQLQASQEAVEHVMRKAFKRYLFGELPQTLLIHLKRFETTFKSRVGGKIFGVGKQNKCPGMTMEWVKNEEYISFPEFLDLKEFVGPRLNEDEGAESAEGNADNDNNASVLNLSSTSSTEYRLFAVIVHKGQIGSGHYYAYVLSDQIGNMKGEGREKDIREADSREPKPRKRDWIYTSDHEVRLSSIEEVLRSRAYMLFYEKI
ncbi:hypothetical protein BY996DRAFT_8441659 [Phakopsora pachyrhizi]|nr:hypothetical protein BY996DRAFT_8441659 [Phakopsora pachyrhizi]